MSSSSTGTQPAQIYTGVEGIGHLLSDRLLAIPDYQRSYSWSSDEVEELWDDVAKAIKRGQSEYFLGSVVTTIASGSKRQFVIDGQQRLATVSLLYAAMRDIFRSRSDERATDVERDFLGRKDMSTRKIQPKLTLNADDNDFYLALINDATSAGPGTRSSHRNLRYCYDEMHKRLSALIEGRSADDWQVPLVELHDYLLNDAKVIDVHVPDEDRSFVIFETLNDRGLNLNTADLLKNHLFGTAGTERIEEAKARWAEMIGALGVGDDPRVADNFLRHYWSSTRGVGRVKALFSDMRDDVETSQQAIDLVAGLAEAAPLWAGMFDADSDYWATLKPKTRDRLRVLHGLKVEQCRPLLLAAMRRFHGEELEKLIACLLNWSIRWVVAGGGGAGVTERLYAEAARDVTERKIVTAAGVYEKFADKVPSDPDFRRAFAAITVRRGWLARYYLHALERSRRAQVHTAELVPNEDWEDANLEHVLPKSYDEDRWPQFTKAEHEGWYLTLGNQAIMLREENDLVGNESFATKGPVLASSKLMLTAEIGECSDWNITEIEKRQARLADLAVETWPHGVD
jgi:hypothetical protein